MKTIIRTISTFACTLLALSATLKAEEKRVVLTFDDSCKSHATFVAPLLKKNGFSATFYITEGFGFKKNKDFYMTWEEIKQLHDMGFEIGNHTKGHMNMRKLPEEKVITEIDYIDAQCVNHGIPKPVTFAYPGYAYSDTVLKVLKERGYEYARTGGGKATQPGKDEPLLLPDALCATPKTTLEELKKAADLADTNHIPIFTFHGVPDTPHKHVSIEPKLFEEFIEYLKEEGFTAIALKDYPSKRASKEEESRVAPK